MDRVKIGVIVVGVVVFIFGITEWRLKTVAKQTPQTITAAQLAANGPGKNANIILTDFTPLIEMTVYEESSKTHRVSRRWVPVVPSGGVGFGEQGVRIVIQDNSIKDKGELQFFSNAPMQGLVINEIASLGGQEAKLLREGLPGFDPKTCYVVHKDRKPMDAMLVMAMLGGGGFAALIGLALVAHDKLGKR